MSQIVSLKPDTMSAEQFEQHIQQIKSDVKRYREVEKSEMLKQFKELQKVVDTPEFQENKNYLMKTQYKDTEEGKTMRRFETAKKSWKTRRYLRMQQDEMLKNYLEFAKTEEYYQLKDKEAVSISPELKQMKRIDGSLKLKIYRWCANSELVKDYNELEATVNDAEFQKRNAFWRNPDRWYTTDESKQDARYADLKKNEDILFYIGQDAKKIAEYEAYQTLFEDQFKWVKKADSAWEAGFYYPGANMKTIHSYVNELQANNGGKNVYAVNSNLNVEVKQEKVTAPAWDEKKGFVQKEYEYTGDVVQTAKKFSTEEGLFLAKIRFEGKANSAFYLKSENNDTLLKMAHYNGKEVVMGLAGKNAETVTMSVKPGQWFVYGIAIDKKHITWTINGQQVLQTANKAAGKKFYIGASAFLPEGQAAGTGNMEVDWLYVFNK